MKKNFRNILVLLYKSFGFIFINIWLFYIPSSKLKVFFKGHFTKHLRKNSLMKSIYMHGYPYFSYINRQKLIKASMGTPTEGVAWAESYRKKGFPDNEFEKNFAYKYTSEFLDKNTNISIHQIGASSGREINYFSNLYPNNSFSCSDINSSITENIMQHYNKLNAFPVDLSDKYQTNKLISKSNLILAFGGLQYLQPEDIKSFFYLVKKHNCNLILSQTFSSAENPYELKNSSYRANFVWNHPYVKIGLQYGLKPIKSSISYEYSTGGGIQLFCAHFSPLEKKV